MRLDRKISSLELLTYRHYRIVHGVRIGLAFILTFLLIRLLAVPEGTWPLITLVVVMGPISFWGNVLQRALQRIAGTVFGAASGLIALYLELYSLPLMLAWCGVVMFVCGYLTLGKRPYMALLVGITLGGVRRGRRRHAYRAVAQRRRDLRLAAGAAVHQHLPTARLYSVAHADGGLPANRRPPLRRVFSPNVIERPRLEPQLRTC